MANGGGDRFVMKIKGERGATVGNRMRSWGHVDIARVDTVGANIAEVGTRGVHVTERESLSW